MSFIYRAKPEGIPNLRQYMRECRLPSLQYATNDVLLPPQGHVSHRNHLSVRPETYRRLEFIYAIDDNVWFALERCLDQFIPSRGLRPNQRNLLTGHGLTVPTSSLDSSPWNLGQRPDHILRLIPWLDRLPFTTVKRLLHLSIPETREWTFRPATASNSEPDSEIFCYYTWSPMTRSARFDPKLLQIAKGRRLLVAMQPPWILTERDLKQFADSRAFPPFLLPGHDFPEVLESSKDRLWAKMWDSCVREKTHYFVLTSYNHWVFGRFSEDYTSAFTSSVFAFDSATPTIIEMLSYWIISAMGLSQVEETEVPGTHYQNPIKIHPPRRPHECMEPEDSKSEWGGSGVDSYDGSAGVYFGSVCTATDGGVVERTFYGADAKQRYPFLEQWVGQNRVGGTARNLPSEEIDTPEGYTEPGEELPFVVEVYFDPSMNDEEARHVGRWLV